MNFTLEILITLFKKMTQHFQDVEKKVVNNKNSDSFAAHFAKTFTQKPSQQECREIKSFDIISTVNPIVEIRSFLLNVDIISHYIVC